MDGADLYAAFGDHPSCHRAVDTSGQQQGRVTVRADRHPADRRNYFNIEIGHIPDFNIQNMLRLMHIHFQIRIGIQNPISDFFVDRGGIHRISFVAPSGIHLKSSLEIQYH